MWVVIKQPRDDFTVKNVSKLFIKISTKGGVTTEAVSLFHYRTNPHRQGLTSHWAVAVALVYFVMMLPKAASKGWEQKSRVWIYI